MVCGPKNYRLLNNHFSTRCDEIRDIAFLDGLMPILELAADRIWALSEYCQAFTILADRTEPAIKPIENLNSVQIRNEQGQVMWFKRNGHFAKNDLPESEVSYECKKNRLRFTKEFKDDAVSLVVEQGYSCAEVSRRLGISENNVNRWVRQHRDQNYNASQEGLTWEQMAAELKRFRKENKRIEMEREILKKAAAFFANESK